MRTLDTVSFDLDGTLRDLFRAVKEHYKFKQFELVNFDKLIINGHIYPVDYIIDLCSRAKNVLLEAKPFPYIVKAANLLSKYYNIQILTASLFKRENLQWLKKHLNFSNFSYIQVETQLDKLEYIKNVLIHIDDCPKLERLNNVIIVKRPYNSSLFDDKDIFAVAKSLVANKIAGASYD